MVIRTRLRAILFPLALYAVSGAIGSYFVWHGWNGERGLKAKVAYKIQIHELEAQLVDLRKEHARWDRRVAQMQADSVDQDLLDQEAHEVLGRIGRNELVVMLPSAQN